MTGFSARFINQEKEPVISFRRKEIYQPHSSVRRGGQVSSPYKCRRSSAASYAGMRLVWNAELMNGNTGRNRAIRSALSHQGGRKKTKS